MTREAALLARVFPLLDAMARSGIPTSVEREFAEVRAEVREFIRARSTGETVPPPVVVNVFMVPATDVPGGEAQLGGTAVEVPEALAEEVKSEPACPQCFGTGRWRGAKKHLSDKRVWRTCSCPAGVEYDRLAQAATVFFAAPEAAPEASKEEEHVSRPVCSLCRGRGRMSGDVCPQCCGLGAERSAEDIEQARARIQEAAWGSS